MFGFNGAGGGGGEGRGSFTNERNPMYSLHCKLLSTQLLALLLSTYFQ